MVKDKNNYNIGVIIGNVHTNHPKELIFGICEAAKELEVNLQFFLASQSSIFYSDEEGLSKGKNYNYQFNTIYDYALMGDLDALIISYGTLCVFLENCTRDQFLEKFRTIPMVVLEEHENGERASFIISDNYQGMTDIMEHLAGHHGYRKIAHVRGPLNNTDAEERYQAYCDIMKKYGADVTDSMVIVGDYSEYVEDKIGKLLDENEGLEAICCANDIMALSAYRECTRRGIVVGRDIAITGYDDFSLAQTMDPPLTTAYQNGYEMGYRAMQNAIALCEGAEPVQIVLPADFKNRNSCGCPRKGEEHFLLSSSTEELRRSVVKVVDRIMDNVALGRTSGEIYRYCTDVLTRMFDYIVESYILEEAKVDYLADREKVIDYLREIVDGPFRRYVSAIPLLGNINEFFSELIAVAEYGRRIHLVEMMSAIQMYVYSSSLLGKETEFSQFQKKTWLSPVFVRDLMEKNDDEKEFYYSAIRKMTEFNIKNAYIYLFAEPITYLWGAEWECPEKMYLAACLEDGVSRSYRPEKRPLVTRKKGFSTYFPKTSGHKLFSFTLFAEQTQYGLIICEIEPEDIPEGYINSLQIGTAIRFLEITKQEKKARLQLRETLKIIQEKNDVLNFISEYDELTGLLNRRGFVEKARDFIKRHNGEKAFFAFMDLDHLKQINDTFGHSEGDYAIRTVAEIIQEEVGEHGVVGRIGGDEFVAVTLSGDPESSIRFRKNLKKAYRDINGISKKPYYVEFSVGVKQFMCVDDLELFDILKEADVFLYEDKKLRRASISRKTEAV